MGNNFRLRFTAFFLVPALLGVPTGASAAKNAHPTTWQSSCAGSREVGNLAQGPITHGNQIAHVFVMVADVGVPTAIGWKYITYSGNEYVQTNFDVNSDGGVSDGRGQHGPTVLVGRVPAKYVEAIFRGWLVTNDSSNGLYLRLPVNAPYDEISAATILHFYSCKQPQ